MPLQPEASVLPSLMTPLGAVPLPDDSEAHPAPSPGVWETISAAFRTENTVGSWLNDQTFGVNNRTEPGYNPWNDIVGTPYEAHWSSFIESNNRHYTETLKRQIDRENEDRRTLAAAGMRGTIAAMAAGIIDPSLLIPVGGEVRAAGKGAWALRGARIGGTGMAIQEGLLQSSQETRTAEQSFLSIGGGVVLGGLLGGAVGTMSRSEVVAAEDALERISDMPRPLPGSVGAAATERVGIGDLTVAGTAAERVAQASKQIAPNLRANFRSSPAARQFSQELAENTLYQTMHAEGRSLGAAVETQARVAYNSRMVGAVEAHNAIFAEMKKAGLNMSRQEFEEAIGAAMRRADTGENDFISRAARSWRERVVQPWTNEAIEHGLLPADVSVKTAESYFTRLWNKQRLNAQEPIFKEKVTAFYEGKLADDYAQSVAALRERGAALDQEVADLRLGPEDRAATLTALEQAGDQLDRAYAPETDIVSRINELRVAKRAAREAGNEAGVKAAQSEIDTLTANGGERLRTYLKERGALRSRHRKVDMNYAGIAARSDAIESSLTNLAEANVRGVQRLVSRGRTLEREMQRLDPERLRQKISDLRSSFYATIVKSEKAAERTARQLEQLEGAPAKQVERMKKALAAERSRTEALNSISRRLEAAEALDPHASLAELRGSIDDLVSQVSEVSMARGEKAARLRERLARLDPKKIDQRIADIGALKARLEREFLDRWEIKRLGQGVDPHAPDVRPDFGAHARDIADEVFDKLTGRNHGDGSVAPDYLVALTRGPMKERTFNIPDALIEEFLDSNVMTAMERYGRTMAADIELTRRFGRADMRDQLLAIRDEYRTLRESAGTEAERLALAKDEKGAIEDLSAMRDLVRGTYKAVENSTNYGRTMRALMAFNYIRTMGGAVIANIAEVYRPAMVHGLGRYMSQGIAPLLTNAAAIKLSVKEAKLAGQVTERVLQSRLMSLGEIGDPYRAGTAVERWLTNGARLGSKWNGLVYWTDAMKSISSVLSQNRIVEAALSGGAKDTRLLAYLGIDGDMAQRVAKQFAEHGDDLDGVKVANTEKWTDVEAVRAYRAAVSKDVDSIIVTKSVGDVPLFAHTPTGRVILQFRNYTFAAHQRITLRAMQENKAQFLSGMIGMTALGMLGAYLRSWRGGEARFDKFNSAASNPGYLVGEGLDMSGVFALPIELGNTVEKLTQPMGFSFNPVKTPVMAAGLLANPDASMQGSSVRFASRDPLSAVLGPSAGLPVTAARAAGAPVNLLTGDEPSQGQANAAMSLIPFGSYLGMREALQAVAGDSPYTQ